MSERASSNVLILECTEKLISNVSLSKDKRNDFFKGFYVLYKTNLALLGLDFEIVFCNNLSEILSECECIWDTLH